MAEKGKKGKVLHINIHILTVFSHLLIISICYTPLLGNLAPGWIRTGNLLMGNGKL